MCEGSLQNSFCKQIRTRLPNWYSINNKHYFYALQDYYLPIKWFDFLNLSWYVIYTHIYIKYLFPKNELKPLFSYSQINFIPFFLLQALKLANLSKKWVKFYHFISQVFFWVLMVTFKNCCRTQLQRSFFFGTKNMCESNQGSKLLQTQKQENGPHFHYTTVLSNLLMRSALMPALSNKGATCLRYTSLAWPFLLLGLITTFSFRGLSWKP